MEKTDKYMFEMVFHIWLAAMFLVIAMVISCYYMATIIDPVVRKGMPVGHIVAHMLLTGGFLTAGGYNVFKSAHYFLRWHDVMKLL